MKKLLGIVFTGLLILVMFYPLYVSSFDDIKTQAIVSDNVELWWSDTNHPEILPILFMSDSMTITRYVDIWIYSDNDIFTTTSIYLGEGGYNEHGSGIEQIVDYQFDLPPGVYENHCRTRIEVEASYLAVGTNETNAEITEDRTFYYTYIRDGEIIPTDDYGFVLCVKEYQVGYKYYLPIIMK